MPREGESGGERERDRERPIDGPTGTCNEISVLEEFSILC